MYVMADNFVFQNPAQRKLAERHTVQKLFESFCYKTPIPFIRIYLSGINNSLCHTFQHPIAAR